MITWFALVLTIFYIIGVLAVAPGSFQWVTPMTLIIAVLAVEREVHPDDHHRYGT